MKKTRFCVALVTTWVFVTGLLFQGTAYAAEGEALPAGEVIPSSIEFDFRVDTHGFGPWMYDAYDATPYVQDPDAGVYAYSSIIWNTDPLGDGTCESVDGSGYASYGTCTAENTGVLENINGVTLQFSDFALSGYQKINWGILGQSYDRRNYTGGTGTISVGGIPKLVVTDSRITMDVNWTAPAGNNGGISGSGWGTIDMVNSDPAWITEFDNGNGQVEFTYQSFDPVIQGCWGCYETHIIIQGAQHVEGMEQLPVLQEGIINFPGADIILDVNSFANGGPNNDQNLFFANHIFDDPGGAAPAGIIQVLPDCYWELSTVLSSIDTDIYFILDGLQDIPQSEFLKILWRETAADPWEVLPAAPSGTDLWVSGVTTLGEFALGEVETCNLTMSVSGSGTVEPEVGNHTYLLEAVVPITATPAEGFVFTNWYGDVTTVANVTGSATTITMNGNKSITANFTRLAVPGDVNNDGYVDIIDVTAVTRIILQLDPPVPAADVNLDDRINVLDITGIIRLILGLD